MKTSVGIAIKCFDNAVCIMYLDPGMVRWTDI